MKGINKVILVGVLGKDPETRHTAAGAAITSITVATSESWKDKATGERKEKTEWHKVKFFGKLAEIAGEYLKKGSQVYVEGKLRTEEYEKDGVKRYSTGVVADEMQMLGGKPTSKPESIGAGNTLSKLRGDNPSFAQALDDPFDDPEIPF